MTQEPNTDLELIKKLLILGLLKSGVSPEAIADVTCVAAKTIRNTYPMRKILKEQ